MRKVTQEICAAFRYGYSKKVGNTETDGQAIWLHGNKIAEKRNGQLWITNCGWSTNVTKERLNGLDGVNIYQEKFVWYLNGKEWNGEWINVSTGEQKESKNESNFDGVAFVAALGDIFGKTQKESNDWKARMLKAGLENKGLIMPEDWDTLTEDEKEKRLNNVIKTLTT